MVERALTWAKCGRGADSFAILAERHLDVPLVLHSRLRGGDEEFELVVDDLDALPGAIDLRSVSAARSRRVT